ncbi:MAG: acyl-ACP--UDP-N-acetylglucosamine O-acyltransferase [Gammaproteobacteria bacterium]|nr:acyl-ACP--UDP-N-acetylglucosamine O-acyltransferase [Gammaproteobacteria bacterium]
MIDSRAIIDPNAKIASGVSIGPYSIIGSDVEIGEDTWIAPHVIINGPTKIGRENKIFQFSSLGEVPQDKKYNGEPTMLEIGDRNVIREFCTFSRGTVQDIGVTRLGDDNWIMAYVHIAHDCQVGNNTIFANNATLAGHVNIEDYVILGGFTLVHQFCTLGIHSFTAMGSAISKDVPPYVLVSGHMAKPYGLNIEGLKRREFSKDEINALKNSYKLLYRSSLSLQDAITQIDELASEFDVVKVMVDFLKNSKRGLIR